MESKAQRGQKVRLGSYLIPFDKEGNQLDYPNACTCWRDGPGCRCGATNWKENTEFADTLQFVSYGRGRSSVTFTMRRTGAAFNGNTVSFFVSDFTDMIPDMVRGIVTGRFTFTKKGQNYGCRMIRRE